MTFRTSVLALAGILAILAGCSGASLVGDDPGGTSRRVPVAASGAAPWSVAGPSYGVATDRAMPLPGIEGPPASSAGAPPPARPMLVSGTFVGHKIIQLRGDLDSLQRAVATHDAQLRQVRSNLTSNAETFHGTVAAINVRLQVGTTPGNPILLQQWNEAQAQLTRLDNEVGRLNDLVNRVASDGALAAYLIDSVQQAFQLTGAVEDDHRQLRELQDEVRRTQVRVERLLDEINQDVARQRDYVSGERTRLAGLGAAITAGGLFSGGAALRAPADYGLRPPAASGTMGGADGRRPFVVIRFDRPNVVYEQPLFTAISEAVERQPDVSFEVVAVSPQGGSLAPARRNAERVMRSLTDMGVPAQRVQLTARTSDAAGTEEVHIFVR